MLPQKFILRLEAIYLSVAEFTPIAFHSRVACVSILQQVEALLLLILLASLFSVFHERLSRLYLEMILQLSDFYVLVFFEPLLAIDYSGQLEISKALRDVKTFDLRCLQTLVSI